MNESSRLHLPFLVPGQAQKEFTHNEALQRLDMLVQPVVESGPLDAPPAEPAVGTMYIVGDQPDPGWAHQRGSLACWTEHGWRFARPRDGMEVSIRESGLRAAFVESGWVLGRSVVSSVEIGGKQVLGSQLPPIQDPVGGEIVDTVARDTLAQVLATLRKHGLIATS